MAFDTVIETERLILRRWRDADREPFAALCADPEVMRHFPAPLGRAQSDALIDREIDAIERDGFGLWAVERKEGQAFIGFVGLKKVSLNAPVDGEIEIGWRLGRPFWRRGYASEAARAALDWVWRHKDAEQIVSFTAIGNLPSRGVMAKIGMRHAPDLDFDHPALAPDSELLRHVVYRITRAEWEAQQKEPAT